MQAVLVSLRDRMEIKQNKNISEITDVFLNLNENKIIPNINPK